MVRRGVSIIHIGNKILEITCSCFTHLVVVHSSTSYNSYSTLTDTHLFCHVMVKDVDAIDVETVC